MRFHIRSASRLRAVRSPRSRRLPRLGWLFGLLLLTSLVLAACDSTNTYPIDFFSEMHYMRSYHEQEPPRLDSPVSAIPYKGGNANVGGALGPDAMMVRQSPTGSPVAAVVPNYSLEEAKDLKNPLPMNDATLALGQQLFAVNCAVCHGEQGKGNGIAATLIFKANDKPVPADLTNPTLLSPDTGQPAQLTDGELFYVLTHGYPTDQPVMPAFRNLLTPEERWALVAHIRQLEGK